MPSRQPRARSQVSPGPLLSILFSLLIWAVVVGAIIEIV